MKKRLIVASATLALLLTSLCGCAEKEPAVPLAEPTSGVTSSDEKSEPESLPESLPESSVESTANESESEPQDDLKNPAGYTVTITSFENGKPVDATVETYDDHGNMIKSVSKNENYSCSYEYNDDGTIRVKYDNEGREEYTYENGLVISCTDYDEFGRVASVTKHTYNEYGDEVEMAFEMFGSVDRYTYEFIYDENGVWTKELLYNTDGKLRGTYTRVLGENGEHLSGRLEEENSLFTYEYKYDEEGREIELHSTFAFGGMTVGENRVVTEYDEQGRTSRITEYSLGGGEQLASIKEFKYTA